MLTLEAIFFWMMRHRSTEAEIEQADECHCSKEENGPFFVRAKNLTELDAKKKIQNLCKPFRQGY